MAHRFRPAPQLPSNLVMVRVGTRAWLAFLLVAWGAVAAYFSLVSSPATFYALRALLGVFEAGAFPAMWHALSTFFPRSRCSGGLALGVPLGRCLGRGRVCGRSAALLTGPDATSPPRHTFRWPGSPSRLPT